MEHLFALILIRNPTPNQKNSSEQKPRGETRGCLDSKLHQDTSPGGEKFAHWEVFLSDSLGKKKSFVYGI